MVSVCRHCHRSFEAFICFECGEKVENFDKPCHQIFVHQGKRVSYGTVCPYCKQITKAPSPKMLEVFYYSRFMAWSTSEIAAQLHEKETTINRLKNNMIRECLWCGKPILPPDDSLKCLMLISQGRSQTDTAIILSHILQVKFTRSKVRTKIERCKKVYGIDPYTLRDPKPICQKIIYSLDELLNEKRKCDS